MPTEISTHIQATQRLKQQAWSSSPGKINSDTAEPVCGAVDLTATGATENNICNTHMRFVPYSAFLHEACFASHTKNLHYCLTCSLERQKSATNQKEILLLGLSSAVAQRRIDLAQPV
jgi:hypothetical protein